MGAGVELAVGVAEGLGVGASVSADVTSGKGEIVSKSVLENPSTKVAFAQKWKARLSNHGWSCSPEVCASVR